MIVGVETADSTCWTLVRNAAAGDPESRATYCRLYGPVIRAYLLARLKHRVLDGDVEDAVQEVFMQCFKPAGALGRAAADRPGGFRAFLYGITRNVAAGVEENQRRHHKSLGSDELADLQLDENSVSSVFDRAFAVVLTQEARRRMAERAGGSPGAELRLRALELMYEKGLPSRAIAEELGLDPAAVYPLMTRARRDFKASLLEVVASYHPDDSKAELEQRCQEVFDSL